MMTHLIAFIAGCVFIALWQTLRQKPSSTPVARLPAEDRVTSDDELEASILAYISINRVHHINDLCQALEHPKGARYVRGFFHKLMEQGKIRYRDMVYTI